MPSLPWSWLYSGPRQVGVAFLGAVNSNGFSIHSKEDMWSLAVVFVSPHLIPTQGTGRGAGART